MQCDAKRVGEDAGANQSPCLIRRGIIVGGAAALAAAGVAKAAGPHDATLLFLRRRFLDAADLMAGAEGREKQDIFLRMTKVASAMTVIPAQGDEAVRAKIDVAGWSIDDEGWTLRLPHELVSELKAK